MKQKKNKVLRTIMQYTFIFIGAIIAAAALEIFLIPEGVIDGGVVGISIMFSHITGITTGLFTILLNIPFLYIGYRIEGKRFVFASVFAIVIFSLWLSVFSDVAHATEDILLATIFGGLLLGIGVGIIIRFGGSLDGTEMLAIAMSKKYDFSVGQLIMFFNVFILGASGFVFGWDKAMYSLITYAIVFKVIDIVVEGIDETKAAMIISDHYEEIGKELMDKLGRSITYIASVSGFRNVENRIIYIVVSRLELSSLKEIVTDIDRHAFISITDVADVVSRQQKK